MVLQSWKLIEINEEKDRLNAERCQKKFSELPGFFLYPFSYHIRREEVVSAILERIQVNGAVPATAKHIQLAMQKNMTDLRLYWDQIIATRASELTNLTECNNSEEVTGRNTDHNLHMWVVNSTRFRKVILFQLSTASSVSLGSLVLGDPSKRIKNIRFVNPKPGFSFEKRSIEFNFQKQNPY